MPKPKAPVDPRYPWPETPPVEGHCPDCGRAVVKILRFGREVLLEAAPRRDLNGLYGVDHDRCGRCPKASPF